MTLVDATLPFSLTDEQPALDVQLIRARWDRRGRLRVRVGVANPRSAPAFVIAELLGVTRTEPGFELMWARASEQPGALWRPVTVETVPAGDTTELDAVISFPIARFMFGDSVFDLRSGELAADPAAELRAIVGWYADVETLIRAERSRESGLALQRLSVSPPVQGVHAEGGA